MKQIYKFTVVKLEIVEFDISYRTETYCVGIEIIIVLTLT